ncbi:MAG: cytochrome c [Gemmatimonadota bacterium]
MTPATALIFCPALLVILTACGGEPRGASARWSGFNPGPTPAELHRGEIVFNTYCLSCHGLHGTGEGLGPPLLDTLYSPARLADDAMLTAVERGVSQRNFHFGAMPPVKRMTRTDALEVIGYVRWLQRQAGGAGSPSSTPTEVR